MTRQRDGCYEKMVIGFKKNPRGKVAADLTIGCRVSFTATIAG